MLNTKSFWIYKTCLETGSAFTILFWILIISFLLVNTFPGFSQNSFEKRPVAACRFSKELCANLRNTSTNRMRGIVLSCLEKSFVHSKAFVVKRLRTYYFKIKLKEELKKILNSWQTLCEYRSIQIYILLLASSKVMSLSL